MILISSFYNEEYMLPWWLRHHKDIFEHGVLFDYYSTDKSAEIIKKICPAWEVRKTRNKDWDFKDNDEEYSDAEREFSGYKMVLTTTEFLVGKLPKLPLESTAFAVPFFRLVDNEPGNKPAHDEPLLEQKRFGFIDTSSKRRFLHNYPDGLYGVGRHNTGHKTTELPMWIFKYVYSPWTEEFIQRKLQMKTYVNPLNIARGLGRHHVWSRDRLEKEYKKALNEKRNLIYYG